MTIYIISIIITIIIIIRMECNDLQTATVATEIYNDQQKQMYTWVVCVYRRGKNTDR